MHQGQGLEIIGQSNMSLVKYLVYGMKRGAALVITTKSIEIWCRHWFIYEGRRAIWKKGFIVNQ